MPWHSNVKPHTCPSRRVCQNLQRQSTWAGLWIPALISVRRKLWREGFLNQSHATDSNALISIQSPVCHAGTCKRTGDAFAIKIMEVVAPGRDAGSNDNTWADVIAEVSILCRLDHPHIISLREFFIHSNKVYLVTTLVKGVHANAVSCIAATTL